MEIVDPWSPIIFKDNFTGVDFDSVTNKIDSLFSMVPVNADVEQDGGISSVAYSKTTNDNPHQWTEFEEFRNWANDKVKYAIEKWQLAHLNYYPSVSWINRHDNGAWTNEHNHRGCAFSCAYYLKVPENSGRFMVRDPMEYHWGNVKSVNKRGGVDDIWYPIEIKAGDFILFPSWLMHKTEKNLSNDSRYVMSINYEIGGY